MKLHTLSLPPRERGLKRRKRCLFPHAGKSLPPRERGLKPPGVLPALLLLQSLPPRERGLKPFTSDNVASATKVAPPAGAWIETSKNVCKDFGGMEGASSLLARSINRYMSFLRSIGPSCVELNLALTNSSFCYFPLMGGFLFKNIGKKRAKTCLLKKLPLPLQSKNGGISSSG